MRDDVTHQPDHAQRSRPPAVQQGQLPDQPQRRCEHEQHIDQRARTDGGDDRDPLRRRRDQAARFLIERRHQFPFRQPDQVGAVDDVVDVALQRGAGPRQLRVLMRKLEQLPHDAAAVGIVVAEQRGGGAQMQLFDGGKPRQSECLAGNHHDKGQGCGAGKCQPEKTEALAAREQILDQAGHAKPEAEQDQSADRGPEHRAPAKSAAAAQHRRLERDRQQRGIGFRCDADGAARRPAGLLRVDHDHAGGRRA